MCSSEALTLQGKEWNCFVESSFHTLNKRHEWGKQSWFIKQCPQSLSVSPPPPIQSILEDESYLQLCEIYLLGSRIAALLQILSKEKKKSSPQLVPSCNLLFELNSCSFSRGGHSCSFILMCVLLIFSIWVSSNIHWSQWKGSHWLQWGME